MLISFLLIARIAKMKKDGGKSRVKIAANPFDFPKTKARMARMNAKPVVTIAASCGDFENGVAQKSDQLARENLNGATTSAGKDGSRMK